MDATISCLFRIRRNTELHGHGFFTATSWKLAGESAAAGLLFLAFYQDTMTFSRMTDPVGAILFPWKSIKER
jgi:hypothetical protein